MTVADRLEALRQNVPGCILVSFGDLGTGLALRTSAARPCKQDYLERIMEQAARTFALSDSTGAVNDRVLVMTPDETRVFVRCLDGNTDVICCICDGPSVADPVTAAARKILSELARAA